MRRKPNSMSKGTVSPHGCCLCLPSCLLRDLRGAKTPFLLFPSKTLESRCSNKERNQDPEMTTWNHGRGSTLCFYLLLHELSSESAHTELELPRKSGSAPPPFCYALP